MMRAPLRELQLNISLLQGFDIPEGLIEPMKIKEKFLGEAFVLKNTLVCHRGERLEFEIPVAVIDGKVVKKLFETHV
jgi:hypothetical protein